MNPLRMDPSRTGPTLRRWFQEISLNYRILTKNLKDLILGENPLGLVENARWRFLSDDQKVEAFQRWLDLQIQEHLLSREGDKYLQSTYKRAMIRSFREINPQIQQPLIGQIAEEQWLSDTLSQGRKFAKLRLLLTRNFEQIKGVNAQMAQSMARVLTEGLIANLGRDALAANLVRELGISKTRARRIARTELVYVQAEGRLDGFEALGIDEVQAMVELTVAGDACAWCQELEGLVLAVEEAHGLIPRHPNCRCDWTSVKSSERRKGLKRTRLQIQQAITASIRAEVPRVSKQEAFRRTHWIGADLKLAKQVPR